MGGLRLALAADEEQVVPQLQLDVFFGPVGGGWREEGGGGRRGQGGRMVGRREGRGGSNSKHSRERVRQVLDV
jgi:hypothetical protein